MLDSSVSVGAAAALLLTLAAAVPVRATSQEWEASVSITYVTGDYGTATDSDLVYVPLVIQRSFEKGKLSLTLPCLWVDSATEVTLIQGVPQVQPGGDSEIKTTKGGIGDMVLDAKYYLLNQGAGWRPGVDLTADIKIPLADEHDGLGTGEFDVGVGFGLYSWLSIQWIAFADFDYNFIGEPAGQSYDNQIICDVGAAHQTTSAWLNSVLMEMRTAVTDEADNSVSLVSGTRYVMDRNLDVFASLELGLSDGAPDFSFTVGFECGF